MKKTAAGRPPKFAEPSSPITVTLPRRILEKLEELDSDRGKAIVKCVDAVAGTILANEKKIEVVKMSENVGLIVIGPCRCLANIPWLRLIEISPARFLLSIPPGTAMASLEVAIIDLLEHLPADEVAEKVLLEELRRLLSHHRRQEEMTKGEILFIDI
jgi:hypothetical protein